MRTLPDGTLVPDVGETPLWDGTRWIYAPPPLIPGPRGPGGGCGGRGPAGPTGPAGSPAPIVTPFQFVPVPDATTTGPGFVTFMTVPVVVTTAGDIELAFSASVEVLTTAPGSTAFQGATLRFLWDGVVIPPQPPSLLPQTSFMEHDDAGVQQSPDSFSNQINLRDIVLAAGVGPHTLEVQFEGIDAQSEVHTFDGSGVLTIQTAPS